MLKIQNVLNKYKNNKGICNKGIENVGLILLILLQFLYIKILVS